MKRWIACILGLITLMTLFVSTLWAQDISGQWQGTLHTGKDIRIVLRVAKTATGGWSGMHYTLDQIPDGIAVPSITVQNATVKYTVELSRASYEGKLNADCTGITGVWTQNGKPLPLDFQRATKETARPVDASTFTIQFIPVDTDVKLEVLDWGGTGRPLILLAGLGNTAHVFDAFAAKLTAHYHVYGITRRGFGASSAPVPDDRNYSADRLGDDVLAVIDALKLNRPVLAGHSIAGEELSSIGSRHPEKVAGLIYIEAGYPYAYYNRAQGNFLLDAVELRNRLNLILAGTERNPKTFIPQLQTILPQFEKDLQDEQKAMASAPPPLPSNIPLPAAALAIQTCGEKYTEIHGPVLALFALPRMLGPAAVNDPKRKAAALADDAEIGMQADAFAAGIQQARVVRLPNGNHYIFHSNEADVLREMDAFISALP